MARGESMKILIILNYYYPYISGLSEYAKQVGEEFVRQGHSVKVLCSNHDNLPEKEIINGVEVTRAPIIAKISKGTVSLAFINWAKKMSRDADVVNLHLPMLESGIISSLIGNNKCVITYHCDLDLKAGIINNFIKNTMYFMNNMALKKVKYILVTSLDYGVHSKLAGKYPDKLVEVGSTIKDYNKVPVEKDKGKKYIGFCGRIVMEKGIDVLIKAFEIVKHKIPEAELLIGGDYQNVAGGSIYPELAEYVNQNKIDDVHFLGKIPEEKMEEFYSSLDVFVLPSINPLEAFGLVQVEAMYCGTPVVSSDLYGVRTVPQKTGMGLVSKKSDPEDLANKIIAVLNNKEKFVKPKEEIKNIYSTEKCAEKTIDIYQKLIG